MRPRVITPELAFQASLTIARHKDGATITRGEAQKALAQLEGAPDAARIVADYLDGHSAVLSERARQVLTDFVSSSTSTSSSNAASGGGRAVDVQARATGMKRLEQLLKGNVQREVHLVRGWLDNARDDFQNTTSQLKRLAHDAMAHFGDDVNRLVDVAKAAAGHSTLHAASTGSSGGSSPAPSTIVSHARRADPFSLKYPSDAEDQGSTTMTSQKYPSDNEDGGAATPVGLPKKVSASHAAHIRRAFEVITATQHVVWRPGSVVEHNAGERFAAVNIGAYTACIPTGPLTPTAKPKDPNAVRSFYVERRSAGLTESSGPFTL